MLRNYKGDVIKITEDPDEGGYVVSCESMPGCLTCGETIEAALESFDDAKACWLEAAEEDYIAKYKQSLETTSGPILLKDMTPSESIDYRDLAKQLRSKK